MGLSIRLASQYYILHSYQSKNIEMLNHQVGDQVEEENEFKMHVAVFDLSGIELENRIDAGS